MERWEGRTALPPKSRSGGFVSGVECSTCYHTVKHPGDIRAAINAKKGGALPTNFEQGVLVGLLIGEGHFGGDGRQPQITLRMHVKHAPLFDWIETTFPGGKLYGPYNHDGRHYLQWMARGSYLRDVLVPLLDDHLTPELDAKSYERYSQMKARYQRRLGLDEATGPPVQATHIPAEEGAEMADEPPWPKSVNDRSRATDIFDRLRREQAG